MEDVGDDVARERIAALDRLVAAEVERLDEQHAAQVHAVQLVREAERISRTSFEVSVAERFAAVNEFRRALDDLGKQMATRREVEGIEQALAARYEDMLKQLAELRSRVDRGPAELAQLAHQQAVQVGRREGVESFTSNPFLAAVLLAVAGIVGHFLK